ncbi:ABC transporter permease [Oceanobacillus picturae]|uniref:ABC transporter permease n=1 Tax=Oceanobacillus picturae TaxID=171693 RepID=A0A0U9H3F8_9BACI|nr:ABC transporter permease [Oceanobacillus picturae]
MRKSFVKRAPTAKPARIDASPIMVFSKMSSLFSWDFLIPNVVKSPYSFLRDLIKVPVEYSTNRKEKTYIITSDAMIPDWTTS